MQACPLLSTSLITPIHAPWPGQSGWGVWLASMLDMHLVGPLLVCLGSRHDDPQANSLYSNISTL
jgi:hypothetical protein